MDKYKQKAVFFDPNHRRWPIIKAGLFWLSLVISIVFIILFISILFNPVLNNLILPPSRALPRGVHIAAPFPKIFASKAQRSLDRIKKRLAKEIAVEQKFLQRSRPNKLSSNIKTIGFYVDWDDTSFSSLKDNLDSIDIVIGEWLHLRSADGYLREDNPDRQKIATDYIAAHKPSTQVIALVNNFNGTGWQSDMLAKALSQEGSRQKMIQGMFSYVRSHQFGGISIDFESVPPTAQDNLVKFLRDLHALFKKNNLMVSVNVPADDDSYNYQKISDNVDYVIVMDYDQHWASGGAGSISGISWFSSIIQKRQKDIPVAKMIIALGNYGYDWTTGKEAKEISFEEAVMTAKESEGKIAIDPVSLNPYFDYYDDNDQPHQVWFMDATTIFNQLSVATTYHPQGFALWRLGSEDPTIWKMMNFDKKMDNNTAQELSSIKYNYGLDYEGQGEILKITHTPQDGQRNISFNASTGMITQESFKIFPSPYIISRYGYSPKKIALTFDDGPDPQYTADILDELKAARVHATFFIIGSNGEQSPSLLRREYNEGHDIGNHTYTHPNITEISATQFQLEVSATERLLEGVVGHKSHLFRSPYAEDVEPETQDEIRPLETMNSRGYIIVGMHIDPNDWRSPGIQEIVDSAVSQIEHGDGNIVLLHDSGGDRSETVAALPLLIKTLQSKGYQMVSISELLGEPRDDIMPPATDQNVWVRWGDRLGFDFLSWWSITIHVLFVIGIMMGLSRLLFIAILAVWERFHKHKVLLSAANKFSVAVIIPAYNEAKVINQTIASLLSAIHPREFEIIVVNDGSTDDTLNVVNKEYGEHPQVKIISIPNDGKPAALNRGIQETSAEIVITLDADTVFTEDTIMQLTKHFIDYEIAAVAGNAKVGNRINLLTKWQALEYIISQNLDRRAFAVLNIITVVPGAVGAWRREILLQMGGFSGSTLAEDADLTINIRRHGHKIVYEDKAIGLTEAPDTSRTFVRQRYRWMFGTLQVAWKHRDVLFRPRYGWLGFFAMPSVFIYQIFFPLISPIMDFLLLITLISSAISKYMHPAAFQPDALLRILYYYALFVVVDYFTSLIAFFLEPQEDKKLLVWLFWQRFYYRQLIYYVAIKTLISTLRGGEVGWNKLERKGTVGGK